MSILAMQKAITARLSRRPFIRKTRVTVIAEDDGDIATKINAAMAKLGICALVSVPEIRPTSKASRVIVCEAALVIEVAENPMVNRARAGGTTCMLAAEYIAGALNLSPIKVAKDLELLPVFDGISPQPGGGKSAVVAVRFKMTTNIKPPDDDNDGT